MRTLYGQIIATSGIDSHGHSIPVDRLRELFNQMPDSWDLCDTHDPAKPPVGRSYNKQFVKLDGGDWAICCDVDVCDEVALERYGGFSIAFIASRITIDAGRKPQIEVTVNPDLIPIEEFHELVYKSTSELQLDVLELHQKALDVPAIIFLSFVSGAIASGFFKAAGADLYGLLKRKIKEWGDRIRHQDNRELQCNVDFTIRLHSSDISICIIVSAAELDILAESSVSIERLPDVVSAVDAKHGVKKVVMRVVGPDAGPLIEHYIDGRGTVHKPTLPAPNRNGAS